MNELNQNLEIIMNFYLNHFEKEYQKLDKSDVEEGLVVSFEINRVYQSLLQLKEDHNIDVTLNK